MLFVRLRPDSPTTVAPRPALAVVATGCAALLLGLAGWAWHASDGGYRGARLVLPGEQAPFGIAEVYRTDPAPHAFGGVPLCTSKAGSLTVTRLVPRGGNGGLRVIDFATRPASASHLFGASQRSLQAEGFAPSATVDRPCSSGTFDELALQVQRTVPGNGWFTSLTVDYDSAGRHLSMSLPFSLKLCGPSARTPDACGRADEP